VAAFVRRLTTEEKQAVRVLIGTPGTRRRLLQRLQIIVLSAQGLRVAAIARQLGVSEHTARFWIVRFNALGLPGLHDLPRPGATPTYGEETRRRICRVAGQSPAALGQPFDCWTLTRLVTYLRTRAGIAISRSRLQEILRDAAVDWRRPVQPVAAEPRVHRIAVPARDPRLRRLRCQTVYRRRGAIAGSRLELTNGASRARQSEWADRDG